MNEKLIKELILKAGFPEWTDKTIGFELETLAELIVKECIEKIQTYNLIPGHSAKWEDIYDIHCRLLQDLGEELKEHFGVE
jgi:hypothetical protein